MAAPRLDALPAELMHRICLYCEKPEIRSLRRVSPALMLVADEYFLDRITIFFEEGDMETAERIVRNDRIAKNIRSLRFQADRLLHLHLYQSWNYLRKLQVKQLATVKGELPSPQAMDEQSRGSRDARSQLREAKRNVARKTDNHSKSELRSAFEKFGKLLAAQHDLMEQARAAACIASLFRSCPRLEAVTITMGNQPDAFPMVPWDSVVAFRLAMVGPFRDDMSNRIGTRPANETIQAALDTGKKLKSLTLAPIDHHFFAQEKEMMTKAHQVIKNLESLYIRIDHVHKQSKDDSEEICRLQRELVRLGLLKPEEASDCIEDDDEDLLKDEAEAHEETVREAAWRVIGAYQDHRVSDFLSHAPHLRELRFEGPIPYDDDRCLRLHHIVGTNIWGNLSTLELGRFGARDQELVDFLLNYSSTLKSLTLRHVCIYGSWLKVIRQLAGKLPELQEVKIRGYIVSDDVPYDLKYELEDDCQGLVAVTERALLTGNMAGLPRALFWRRW